MGIVKPREDNGGMLDPSRFQSLANSAPLVGNAVFTQPWIDSTETGFVYPMGSIYGGGSWGPTDVNFVSGSVFANTAGTLFIEQSDDKANISSLAIGVPAGIFTPVPLQQITSRFYRFRYVNGAAAQATFVLSQVSERIDAFETVTTKQGNAASLNIAAATVVKASPGRLIRISVIVAGTTAGSVNDTATTGAAAAANQIAAIPNTVGVILLDWPCTSGIVITPGTGQTLAVSFS